MRVKLLRALCLSGDAPGVKRECDLARPLLTPAEQKEFHAQCSAAL